MGVDSCISFLKNTKQLQKITWDQILRKSLIAVDGNIWLFQTYFSLKRNNQHNNKQLFLDAFLRKVSILNFMIPLIVFDGNRNNLKILSSGKPKRTDEKDRPKFETHTRFIIEALRTRGISYIFAPYESDHQLSYLLKQGTVNYVLTGDSDLFIHFHLIQQDAECMGNVLYFDNIEKNLYIYKPQEIFKAESILKFAWTSGCDYGVEKKNLENDVVVGYSQHVVYDMQTRKQCYYMEPSLLFPICNDGLAQLSALGFIYEGKRITYPPVKRSPIFGPIPYFMMPESRPVHKSVLKATNDEVDRGKLCFFI